MLFFLLRVFSSLFLFFLFVGTCFFDTRLRATDFKFSQRTRPSVSMRIPFPGGRERGHRSPVEAVFAVVDFKQCMPSCFSAWCGCWLPIVAAAVVAADSHGSRARSLVVVAESLTRVA